MSKELIALGERVDDAQRSIWKEQVATWHLHVAGAKQGNPWATLCEHCYGRHQPPRDDICPHPDLKGLRSKRHLPIELRERDVSNAVFAALASKGDHHG